jgi:hypothetical protein
MQWISPNVAELSYSLSSFSLHLVNQLVGDFHAVRFRLSPASKSKILVRGSTNFRGGFRSDPNVCNPKPIRVLLGVDDHTKFSGNGFSEHACHSPDLVCD